MMHMMSHEKIAKYLKLFLNVGGADDLKLLCNIGGIGDLKLSSSVGDVDDLKLSHKEYGINHYFK